MPRVSTEYSQASRKTYKRFKEENPEIKITFHDYASIIYSFNYGFRDYLFETGNKGKLPYGLGDFAISKWKPKTASILDDRIEGEKKPFVPVDWKLTKEAGHYVYHLNLHTDGWKFKVKWLTQSARFFSSVIWYFRPSRVTSRTLRHYINQKEYRLKYLEW